MRRGDVVIVAGKGHERSLAIAGREHAWDEFEVVARGFRAPNGIGVRADGQVTTSDNEGTWVPTTPLNWVDGKAFHGVINDLTPKDLAEKFSPPILWLSHNDYDNSGGGQVWVTSDTSAS